MSEAVDGAEVFLYAVTERYKESANCRLVRSFQNLPAARQCAASMFRAYVRAFLPALRMEANYAFQSELDMIPLMMQENYKPKGWVSRAWHSVCVR